MVLYTNYKQMAKITLKSEDAVDYEKTTNVIVGHETAVPMREKDPVTIIGKYTYRINLPFMQFGKNTRLAVDTFSIQITHRKNQNHLQTYSTPDVYIKNIHKKDVYNSTNKSAYGTCLLSIPFNNNVNDVKPPPITYQNFDLINNSIDITGSTAFLQGEPLEIFIDTKILRYKKDPATTPTNLKMLPDGYVEGCPDVFKWSLSFIVYEEEKEENPKDYVDDRAKPHSIPALY